MVTKGQKKGSIRFSTTPPPGTKKVELAGTFTGWKPTAMKKQKSGAFVALVTMRRGRHEYKLLVDGRWVAGGGRCMCVVNPYGTVNSVVVVD